MTALEILRFLQEEITTPHLCGAKAGNLLAEAIAQLPEDKRDVILLSYFLDMNDREISERLNVVCQTISKWQLTTLKELCEYLGKAAAVNIDGYKSFLFLNQSGYPKVASSYKSMFKGFVKKYNKQHKEDETLPNITPHTLWHTFCTRLANAGMNPKALQYITSHSNIIMTLNYYAHATYVSAKAEMDRLAA